MESGNGYARCAPVRRRALLTGLKDGSGFAVASNLERAGKKRIRGRVAMATHAARPLGEERS
ncbi:hypothetical protein N0O92_00275 [Alkalihalobacillus sp. MEB130]|uniref:hypothetical protein n=1 Tax=Alkalihalobacillus sp. MEB130 TaxID=2976704 RepID=UPI0028DEAF6E|nr:hypothetical protein [Alkalihalobacillus sp. MEB130]MDT8858643.1 hypothetical protein [Alkalihalobacillus sp. MEB130]